MDFQIRCYWTTWLLPIFFFSKLPAKIIREWKALFLNSQPLYDTPVSILGRFYQEVFQKIISENLEKFLERNNDGAYFY